MPPIGCADFRRTVRADRRNFLKAGLFGAAGLTLADVLRASEPGGSHPPARQDPGELRHPVVDAGRAEPPAYDPKASNRCGCPSWAQRMLLARRLVEAGVRLVTVDLRWWDTHVKGFESLRDGFLPRWDRAFTALLDDLEQRGLLETTLVLAWGEFGRTPKVNNDAGRDHYPNVFSAALAGGPVVGESDSNGAFPKSNPKTPQDVLATVYRHLGVDAAAQYVNNGRPIAVLPSGTPIGELG